MVPIDLPLTSQACKVLNVGNFSAYIEVDEIFPFPTHMCLNQIPFSGDSLESWLPSLPPILVMTAFLGALHFKLYFQAVVQNPTLFIFSSIKI